MTPALERIAQSLAWLADHGVWDLLQAAVVTLSAVVGAKLFFFPKTRIRNLNLTTSWHQGGQFPSRVHLQLRNYTGVTIVISNPFFVYRALRPDPQAHGHSSKAEFEIKFPSLDGAMLSEVEYLLRHKENVSTFASLDPSHSEEEVARALTTRRVGTLHLTVTWLTQRPHTERLALEV